MLPIYGQDNNESYLIKGMGQFASTDTFYEQLMMLIKRASGGFWSQLDANMNQPLDNIGNR